MTRSMPLLMPILLFVISSGAFAQHQYVGTKLCAPCHRTEKQGKQFDIWKSSKHAQAFELLKSEESKAIAKKMGLSKGPEESPECLRCHAPQFDVDAKLIAKTFVLDEGVQCESCHGPGSDYKSLTVMRDRKKALAAGMIIASDDPKLCEQCHNKQSPTYKDFDYEEMWAKIKHPVPEAKK